MNIKVYIKANTDSFITQIGSSLFIKNTTSWIQIDEGKGNKYVHAQTQYLSKPIIDKQGRYNYKLVDGKVVELTEEEKPVIEVKERITTTQRIEALENALLELVLGGAE